MKTKEDVHFNKKPVIRSHETLANKVEGYTQCEVVYFAAKFVTNDWQPSSELISSDPRYIEAQDTYVAYAMDQLGMRPGIEYDVHLVWPNEAELWIYHNDAEFSQKQMRRHLKPLSSWFRKHQFSVIFKIMMWLMTPWIKFHYSDTVSMEELMIDLLYTRIRQLYPSYSHPTDQKSNTSQ